MSLDPDAGCLHFQPPSPAGSMFCLQALRTPGCTRDIRCGYAGNRIIHAEQRLVPAWQSSVALSAPAPPPPASPDDEITAWGGRTALCRPRAPAWFAQTFA